MVLAGCSGHTGATQPPVVIRERASRCEQTGLPSRDAYENALARARCDHPDMLVHPRAYVLRRVASRPNVARFALDGAAKGTSDCCYEVDEAGTVRRVP